MITPYCYYMGEPVYDWNEYLRLMSDTARSLPLVHLNLSSAAIVAHVIQGDTVDHGAYTDQTIRLNAHCRECSDVLPVDAQFCISCGAPVC